MGVLWCVVPEPKLLVCARLCVMCFFFFFLKAKLERCEAQGRLLEAAAKDKDAQMVAAKQKADELRIQVRRQDYVTPKSLLQQYLCLKLVGIRFDAGFVCSRTCPATHFLRCLLFLLVWHTVLLLLSPSIALPTVSQVEALQKAQEESTANASRREHLLEEEARALRWVVVAVGWCC